MYSLQVKQNGKWMSLNDVFEALLAICDIKNALQEIPIHERVPLLTSLNRRKWGKARASLIQGIVQP